MTTVRTMLCGILVSAIGGAAALAFEAPPMPRRPDHTFSIVARDPETGELGVAVQSHWFSVGSRVAWAEPGVGAVATQSFTEVTYGPLGLDLMRAGKSAPDALNALRAIDPIPEVRQVGMVDAEGRAASFTGEKAIIEQCRHVGKGYSVQANLMEKPTVCAAMVRAYETTKGDLAERMMAALEAAQAEGGDIRGRQSAALVVVGAERVANPWEGRLFDLRIEDHPEPILELRRLLTLARAYRKMNEGDDLWAEGKVADALAAYSAAETLAPGNHEMIFWHAATLAAAGRVDESLPLFAEAFSLWPLWRDLVPRLPASGLLPDDPALIARILDAGR
ncbi:MAG: hypothetical protein Kow00104_10290 [Rhodothalassiaceae bacterium]